MSWLGFLVGLRLRALCFLNRRATARGRRSRLASR
jgi:hypothetical protein